MHRWDVVNNIIEPVTWSCLWSEWDVWYILLHSYFWHFCAVSSFRQPYYHGKEPRVPVQPPRTGESRKGEDAVGRNPRGARGLDLRSARASGEAGDWHEAGDGEKVCQSSSVLLNIRNHFVYVNFANLPQSLRRLTEMEILYKKEKEEADQLLEQQRLVSLITSINLVNVWDFFCFYYVRWSRIVYKVSWVDTET